MPADDETAPLLTTGELAKRLNVATNTINSWVRKGQLVPTVVTPGGKYRWRWSDVERQLRDQRLRDE